MFEANGQKNKDRDYLYNCWLIKTDNSYILEYLKYLCHEDEISAEFINEEGMQAQNLANLFHTNEKRNAWLEIYKILVEEKLLSNNIKADKTALKKYK